jgi:RNA polymerase sigma-70 factor (ECF subfamily)
MSEQELIAQINAGDPDAFGFFVEQYYRGLFNHLYLMVKEPDWAEDLTQEAFVKAYLQLHRYDSRYRFSTWLYRIGTNGALNSLRRRQAVSLDDIPELPDAYDAAAAGQVEAREAAVRGAVARLPLKYQTVVSLHYWQDLTYEEAALALGVPVGTVKTWLHRAKQLLKQDLGADS